MTNDFFANFLGPCTSHTSASVFERSRSSIDIKGSKCPSGDICISGISHHVWEVKSLVISITHQVHFVMVFNKANKHHTFLQGAVAGLGTYEELQAKGTDFAALLHKDE